MPVDHLPPDHREPAAAPLRLGSLCTGYGGLDLAVRAVLGGELVFTADPDRNIAAALAARFPGVPNIGDITAVDFAALARRAPVDVLTAGFPCQDISGLGHRAGIEKGTRSGLWFDVARAVRAFRPRLLVVENVAALRYSGRGSISSSGSWPRRGMTRGGAPYAPPTSAPHTLGSGCSCSPGRGLISATTPMTPATAGSATGSASPRPSCGVGALIPTPIASDTRIGAPPAARRRHGQRPPARGRGDHDRCLSGPLGTLDIATTPTTPAVIRPVDSDPHGRPGDRRDDCGDGCADGCGDGCGLVFDTLATAARVEWGACRDAIERWARVLGRSAPPPVGRARSGRVRLSPRFVEWLMGLPAGWVTDVAGLSWTAQIHALGNGVVPRQAETALRLLLHEAGLCTDTGTAAGSAAGGSAAGRWAA